MLYARASAHRSLLADGADTMPRTSYDIEAACAAIRDRPDYPEVTEWADYFLFPRVSDADAVSAFFCPARRPGRMIMGAASFGVDAAFTLFQLA